MEKGKIKKNIFFSITIIWTILTFTIYLIEHMTEYFFIYRFLGIFLDKKILTFILSLIFFSWIIYFLIKAWKVSKKKILKILLVVGWIILILALIFSLMVGLIELSINRYFEFTSLDKENTLLVKESSFLLLSSIGFYERNNIFFVEPIDAYIGADDGFTPISRGRYSIEWDNNRVSLAIDANYNQMWTKVSFNLGTENRDIEYETIDLSESNNVDDNKIDDNKINDNKIDDNKIDENILKEDLNNPQKRLDNMENAIDYVNLIDNSNYGIIEMDRAMARSLWYFVEIKGDKLIYISELQDNSPTVSGEIDENGNINLEFKDINDNIYKYKSIDDGKTWIKK